MPGDELTDRDRAADGPQEPAGTPGQASATAAPICVTLVLASARGGSWRGLRRLRAVTRALARPGAPAAVPEDPAPVPAGPAAAA